jgi:hypothetical protein
MIEWWHGSSTGRRPTINLASVARRLFDHPQRQVRARQGVARE